jgi:hypothetical protein
MGRDPDNTSREGASPQQRRLLALDRANHIRFARAVLKRRLRAGELGPADTILRGSTDTDTMTVAELLRSQRGWGPKRSSKLLRSLSLSERKTLGSLTERQRATLVGVLSGPDPG